MRERRRDRPSVRDDRLALLLALALIAVWRSATDLQGHVRAGSQAIGRSLAELDLRSLTGATVIAIRRGGDAVSLPAAHEVRRAGDLLALAGTEDAVEAARALLRGESA